MGGKRLVFELRTRIIQKRQSGLGIRQIGRDLCISESTIRSFLKKFDVTGNVEPGQSLGRPPTTSPRDDRLLRRVVMQHRPGTMTEAASLWQEHLTRPVSRKMATKRLHKMGFKSYKSKRKPMLTKLQRRKRFQWAKNHLSWTDMQWQRIIWSDESPFPVMYGNIGRRVIRQRHESLTQKCIKQECKFPASIQIWGCFGNGGIGKMTAYDGTVNAKRYQDILDQFLLPSIAQSGIRQPIFQQDLAKPHTAMATQRWLQDHDIAVLDWVPNSPDLNPIEDLWLHLKKQVRKRKPRSKQDLKLFLQEEWQKIPLDICQQLISTMSTRVKDVYKAKGGVTKW